MGALASAASEPREEGELEPPAANQRLGTPAGSRGFQPAGYRCLNLPHMSFKNSLSSQPVIA
jgi:hypothetical protein